MCCFQVFTWTCGFRLEINGRDTQNRIFLATGLVLFPLMAIRDACVISTRSVTRHLAADLVSRGWAAFGPTSSLNDHGPADLASDWNRYTGVM